MADLTKQDLVDAFSAAFEKTGLAKSSGSTITGSTGPAAGNTGFKAADDAAGSVAKKLGGSFSEKLDSAGKGIGDLGAAAQKNIGTWQQLSSQGANFGNDVVGMSTAAAGSRVNLTDFADTISKNNQSFIGLGGNVSQGAQKFAQLTDEMYTNSTLATDQLRQQGYTNKELNDVLALQVGFQRGSLNLNDPKAKQEAIDASLNLADEMNQLAQLNGVSRKEMQEKLAKEAVNAQVEAKFRLIAATQGEEAAHKARMAYQENFAQAEARGEGQRFREIFATGHEVTKEAAQQGAMLGKQGQATAAQARAAAEGDMEKAKAANQLAREGQLENSKNVTLLTMATYGKAAGAMGEMSQDMVNHTRGVYDSEAKIRQEAAFKNASNEEIAAEELRRAKLAAHGKDEEGNQQAGSATTKAAINIEQRINDASSALMKNLVTPLNEKAGPAINKFADTALGAQQKLANGTPVTTPQAMNKAVEQGMTGGEPKADRATGLVNEGLASIGASGRLISKAGETIADAMKWVEKAFSSKPEQAPGKADGGIVPGTDKGTTVTVGEKGKPEAIVPLDQLKNAVGATGGAVESSNTNVSPVGGMPSNEELKAKAEEAIRIIQEHGQGSFNTQIKITASGNLRLREQFDENNEKMQVLGDTSSRERIAELIKQADDLKNADQQTAQDRIGQIKQGAEVEQKQKEDLSKLEVAANGSRASKGAKAAMDQLEEMNKSYLAAHDISSKEKSKATAEALQKESASVDLLKLATKGEPVQSAENIAKAKADAMAEAYGGRADGGVEAVKSQAQLMAEAYGGRADGGVEAVKPKQTIEDMMGDAFGDMANSVDIKGISKNIKTSVSTSETKKDEKSTPEKSETERKAEVDKQVAEFNKQHEHGNEQQHKATLDDVLAALMMLNRLMSQQNDHADKLVRVTKNMSGNKLARG